MNTVYLCWECGATTLPHMARGRLGHCGKRMELVPLALRSVLNAAREQGCKTPQSAALHLGAGENANWKDFLRTLS